MRLLFKPTLADVADKLIKEAYSENKQVDAIILTTKAEVYQLLDEHRIGIFHREDWVERFMKNSKEEPNQLFGHHVYYEGEE